MQGSSCTYEFSNAFLGFPTMSGGGEIEISREEEEDGRRLETQELSISLKSWSGCLCAIEESEAQGGLRSPKSVAEFGKLGP